MNRKTEAQLRKDALTYVARAAIRARHKIAADRELNAVLPDLLDAFDDALALGILPGKVNLSALVAGVLDEPK